MSWSDCKVLTLKVNEVNNQIVAALTSRKNDQGFLFNHDHLSVALIELQETILRIQTKDKKEFDDKTK